VSIARSVTTWILPRPLRRRIARAANRLTRWPPLGSVSLGDLDRTRPISSDWGFDRGTPIDRYYTQRFMQAHASAVRGRVLEVGMDLYTRRFGGDRVSRSDVLHVEQGHPGATLIADLAVPDSLPAGEFDCIIVTQTLQFIYDVETAVRSLHRSLAPGGVVLAAFPGITKLSREDVDRWGQYWSLTTLSAQRLFTGSFPAEKVQVEAMGNVLTAAALLYGLAAEDLTRAELEAQDRDYEVLVAVRAERPEGDA
jgi:SAM-dependent methyltransferase